MKIYKLFILLMLVAFVGLITIPTFAVSKLNRSDPSPDSVINQSPSEVFVWFLEPLTTGSSLNVFDEQFERVDKGQTFIDASDATLMRVGINQLWPGRYTVKWKANPVSGRSASGTYTFRVKNEPLPVLQLAIGIVGGVVITVVAVVGARRLRRRV